MFQFYQVLNHRSFFRINSMWRNFFFCIFQLKVRKNFFSYWDAHILIENVILYKKKTPKLFYHNLTDKKLMGFEYPQRKKISSDMTLIITLYYDRFDYIIYFFLYAKNEIRYTYVNTSSLWKIIHNSPFII